MCLPLEREGGGCGWNRDDSVEVKGGLCKTEKKREEGREERARERNGVQ